MTRIYPGISQIGGKSRSLKTILEYIPHHEFFLSLFAGACWVELNKPRCRYECFNDNDAEIINYFLMIREHPEEFEKMKEGVLGLVSQEIANRIFRGEIQPKNNLERAYYFYYLNKVGFSGFRARKNLPYRCFSDAKANNRGVILPTTCKDKSINEAKASYRGVALKASYKGISPKTTRPWTNNDNGLITPLSKDVITRLQYVNLTNYDFKKVYKLFYRAFYKRKGLEKECLVYADPPYPGTEQYYGKENVFNREDHEYLITKMKESPFNFTLSIGGECDFYLEELEDMNIVELNVKYSTSANHQYKRKEYLIMNYEIDKEPKMIFSSEQEILEKYF